MKLLLSEKVPYLLTLFLGLLGYQLNHITDYLLETPIVNYNFEVISRSDTANTPVANIRLTLQNLSRKTAFKELTLDLKYSGESANKEVIFTASELISISPAAMLPDSNVTANSKIIRVHIPQLQPNGTYQIYFSTQHSTAENFPKLYLSCADSIWLSASGIQVFLIENQLLINLLLAVLWLAGILFYIIFVPTKQNIRHEKV